MPGVFGLFGRQLLEIWKHFGINQKVSVLLALLATIGGIAALLVWSGRPDYRLLYSGLTLEDAGSAQEKLEDARIPVQLRDHGQSLYVPAAHVYRSRLMLAQEGLPQDTSTGFELFEQPKFGMTDFAQQVNFQRALQGELERTVNAMEGIQASRIMLVLPREKLFAQEKEKTASASVMLSLRRGATISAAQVMSVRQLVSSAVPGLGNGSITITDQQGRLLSDNGDEESSLYGISSRQLEVQQELEERLARKAQEMLNLAVGPGLAMVQVSAELDFRRIESHKETYDSEGRVVARESISSESSSEPVPSGGGRDMARVVVGAPDDVRSEQASSTTRREDIDTEYRIPSGREIMLDEGGRIKSLSVSVCIAEGETPRTEEELKRIESMVRSAVGIVQSPERKDRIDVVEMAFAGGPVDVPGNVPVAEWNWWQALPFSWQALSRSIMAVALLLGLFLLSRNALARLSVQREDVGVPVGMLAGADGYSRHLPDSSMSQEDISVENSLDNISRLAEESPETVANWIENVARTRG